MAFSFGATTSQTGGGFFGTNTSKGFSFGAAKTTASTFGTFQQTPAQNIGFGAGFGTNTSTVASTASSGFGGFGTNTGLSGGFTGFGNTTLSGNTFGNTGTSGFANDQQQQQEALKHSVTAPVIFGDDRDQVLLKWNQLQACWGTGKGFYSPQGAFVTYAPDNPFSLFKSIGYSCMPTNRNESGLVVLMFEKEPSEVASKQAYVGDAIHKLLGSKATLTVCIDSVKPFQDNRCEVTVYTQERQSSGANARVPSSDLLNFLNQKHIKQQLATQLSVINVYAKVSMDPQQFNFYLQHPPAGIDRRIWEQAKLDNPDPSINLPVPIVGFQELKDRLKNQQQQTELHQLKLSSLSTDVLELECRMQAVVTRTDELKRKQLVLTQRLLKVIVKQEVLRKWGFPVQPEEEQLSGQMQSLHSEINTPSKTKSRLTELKTQARQQSEHLSRPDVALKLTPEVSHDIKQHLSRQHEGLRHLLEVLKSSLQEVKDIETDLALLPKASK